MQHQALVDYLEAQAHQRHTSLNQLGVAIGLEDGQLYQYRKGTVPGLKICKAIALYFPDLDLMTVLYMAGHLTEEEFIALANASDEVSPEDIQIAARIGAIPDPERRRKAVDLIHIALDLAGY